MSVKAQALVWELECPAKYGEIDFKPSHKYVLIAYADHADHAGKSIYPAVDTIARKTGFDPRTIQRLTRDMELIGLLIADGSGPMGTRRWRLPYNEGGDKLSPRQFVGGDKNAESLGDIPSGDIPSGGNLSPELNKPEPNILKDEKIKIIQKYARHIWGSDFKAWTKIRRVLEDPSIDITGDEPNIIVAGMSGNEGQIPQAYIFQERYGKVFENQGLFIQFTE